MASGAEYSPTRLSLSLSLSLSVGLSFSLSLGLTLHASEAPADDQRERISTVDPCCGRALASLICVDMVLIARPTAISVSPASSSIGTRFAGFEQVG
jgi:hypothetical protein